MNKPRIIRMTRMLLRVVRGLLMFASPAMGACLQVAPDPKLQIAENVHAALAKAGLHNQDLYNVMQIVARYETNGCWGGVVGDFDGQWLSAGVMQWNFGSGSLQPLLKRYVMKFSSQPSVWVLDVSCRTIPIGDRCKELLKAHDDLAEVEQLFESDVMRQIQLDYFARAMTTVLDDIHRLFGSDQPKCWQVAWAMDLKTQQGHFPTDTAIKQIRERLAGLQPSGRRQQIAGILEWYDGLCKSGYSDGVRDDCAYNMTVWGAQVLTPDREETLHFTHLLSRTAVNQDGLYQADTFQRRATIVFGKGSVHGNRIEFGE